MYTIVVLLCMGTACVEQSFKTDVSNVQCMTNNVQAEVARRVYVPSGYKISRYRCEHDRS